MLQNVPSLGQIFSGTRAKGITNNVKKEFKDCGHMFSISNEIDEALKEKDDKKEEQSSFVDSSILSLRIERAGKNFIIDDSRKRPSGDTNEANSDTDDAMEPLIKSPVVALPTRPASKRTVKPTMKIQGATQPADIPPPSPSLPAKGITTLPVSAQKPDKAKLESRTDRIARLELEINENISKMRRIIDKFVTCLFCQQCKTVSVDVTFLLSHFHIHHLQDGVNNIMGETAQNCIQRVKKYLKDTKRREVLFNYCPREELFVLEFYRCSYCPTTECKEYSDLFKHTETVHQTKILTCNICRNIFLNYGSLISHVCTGPPTSNATRATFACKVCLRVDLHSFLEFQCHIRKEHNICEICFTSFKDQESLLKHCTSHDQDMMCMKCFVTFEKAISFRKHLFFKHSGEQKECLNCHCPTWPHVYHFCLPDNPIPCHNCDMTLANAAAFKVHSRKHQGVTPHVCTQPNCNRSYISKSLLWKHQVRRHPQLQPVVSQLLRRRKLKQDVTKFGAQEVDSLDVCLQVLDLVWDGVCKKIDELEPPDIEPETEKKTTTPEVTETSVLDAAIRSIMPESEDESKAIDTSALQESDRNAVQSTIAEKAYTADNSWQAGIDALLAGASMKMPKVPAPSDLPPDQLFQNTDHEDGIGSTGTGIEPKSSPGGGPKAPVIGGLWNQDLIFVGNKDRQDVDEPQQRQGGRLDTRGGLHSRTGVNAITHNELYSPQRPTGSGPRVRGRGARTLLPRAIRTNFGVAAARPPKKSEFDLNLSESSDEDDNASRRTQYTSMSYYKSLVDHDYCYAAFMMGQEPPEDTREMDKIVSNVTFDQFGDSFEPEQHEELSYIEDEQQGNQETEQLQPVSASAKRPESSASSETSSADESPDKMIENVDVFGMAARRQLTSTPAVPSASTPYISNESADSKVESGLPVASPALTPFLKRGPKPKYHTPDVAKYSGVTAGTARPSFDTDSSKGSDTEDESDSDDDTSCDDIASSDLDTDFSADESIVPKSNSPKGKSKSPATKAKPNIKLKIKLPPQKTKDGKSRRSSKKKRKSTANEEGGRLLSKKMRESLALNQRRVSSEEEEEVETSGDDKTGGEWAAGGVKQRDEGPKYKNGGGNKEDTNLYCYCQCPHDEYSEMIGCDAPDCRLEWFHFECVNILVPPKGKWFCPECTKRYGLM